MSATTYDIPYTAKLGWEISASGLDEGALSLVKAAIAAQERWIGRCIHRKQDLYSPRKR